MSGLGLAIPGNGPGEGPIIPMPLPSLGAGVPAFTHRYSGYRLDGVEGTVVTSWKDAGTSPSPLYPEGSGAGSGVIIRSEAYPFLRITDRTFNSAVAMALPGTIMGIVRKPALGGTSNIISGGVGIARAGNGVYQVSGLSPGSGSFTVGTSQSGWVFFVASLVAGANTQTMRVNGTSVSNTLTPGTPPATNRVSSGGNYVYDVLELGFLHGVALDETQRVAMYNAMRAAYSSILP